MTSDPSSAGRAASEIVRRVQERICEAVAEFENSQAFRIDEWSSEGEDRPLQGSGSTRVSTGGAVFEKAGVNSSVVSGSRLPQSVIAQRPDLTDCGFFAAGVSAVLHPANPYAPTAHCNLRYFEALSSHGSREAWWFGGGADLTPFYPVLEDVRHFHSVLRDACDRRDPDFYPAFKAWCDRYFYLAHRRENRGVGGIFYDYLDEAGFGETSARTSHARVHAFDDLLGFMRSVGDAFVAAYFPLVERRRDTTFGARERSFQLLRRGRYVEFNLIYDRGTHFGLQSGGRVESILMSLPPLVRWGYDERPPQSSREAELELYLQPRDWFADNPLTT